MAKFHYAILLANSSRAGSRASLRPASELDSNGILSISRYPAR